MFHAQKFAMDLACVCIKPQMRLHVCHQMRSHVCHHVSAELASLARFSTVWTGILVSRAFLSKHWFLSCCWFFFFSQKEFRNTVTSQLKSSSLQPRSDDSHRPTTSDVVGVGPVTGRKLGRQRKPTCTSTAWSKRTERQPASPWARDALWPWQAAPGIAPILETICLPLPQQGQQNACDLVGQRAQGNGVPFSGDRIRGSHRQRGRGRPSRPTADTSVVSIANCCPSAKTSTRRSSSKFGATMSMSWMRMLVDTLLGTLEPLLTQLQTPDSREPPPQRMLRGGGHWNRVLPKHCADSLRTVLASRCHPVHPLKWTPIWTPNGPKMDPHGDTQTSAPAAWHTYERGSPEIRNYDEKASLSRADSQRKIKMDNIRSQNHIDFSLWEDPLSGFLWYPDEIQNSTCNEIKCIVFFHSRNSILLIFHVCAINGSKNHEKTRELLRFQQSNLHRYDEVFNFHWFASMFLVLTNFSSCRLNLCCKNTCRKDSSTRLQSRLHFFWTNEKNMNCDKIEIMTLDGTRNHQNNWKILRSLSEFAWILLLQNVMSEVHVRTMSKNVNGFNWRENWWSSFIDVENKITARHIDFGSATQRTRSISNSMSWNWFHVIHDSTCPFASSSQMTKHERTLPILRLEYWRTRCTSIEYTTRNPTVLNARTRFCIDWTMSISVIVHDGTKRLQERSQMIKRSTESAIGGTNCSQNTSELDINFSFLDKMRGINANQSRSLSSVLICVLSAQPSGLHVTRHVQFLSRSIRFW